VLLWNNHMVPQWTYGRVRAARWDRFSRPEKLPEYGNSAFRPCGGGMWKTGGRQQ
jgi:microcin C transport system substrate-binding protein